MKFPQLLALKARVNDEFGPNIGKCVLHYHSLYVRKDGF